MSQLKTDKKFDDFVDEMFKKFDEFYKSERQVITNQLTPLYEALTQDAFALTKLQSECLNISLMLQEQMNEYLTQLIKYNKKIRAKEGVRLEKYLEDRDLTSRDRKILLENDLKDLVSQKELLEIHVDFIKESKKHCIQIGYAVKNRMALIASL